MIDLSWVTKFISDTLTTLDCRENLKDSITDTRYKNDRKIGLVPFDENFAIRWNHIRTNHIFQSNRPIFSLWSIFDVIVMALVDQHSRAIDSWSNFSSLLHLDFLIISPDSPIILWVISSENNTIDASMKYLIYLIENKFWRFKPSQSSRMNGCIPVLISYRMRWKRIRFGRTLFASAWS